MYGAGITLAAICPPEKPKKPKPGPSSAAPSIAESATSDESAASIRHRPRHLRFWTRNKGKAKASKNVIDLAEESSVPTASITEDVISITARHNALESTSPVEDGCPNDVVHPEKQDFSNNNASWSKSPSGLIGEEGALPLKYKQTLEGSSSEHTHLSYAQEKLVFVREQTTSQPAHSSSCRAGAPPKARLLSPSELQLVQRLSEQNVPPDALATVIKSMANAGSSSAPVQPQPQQRRPLNTHGAPPAYDA